MKTDSIPLIIINSIPHQVYRASLRLNVSCSGVAALTVFQSFTVLAHSDYSHQASFYGGSGYSAKTTPLYATSTKQQERLVTTAKEFSVSEE